MTAIACVSLVLLGSPAPRVFANPPPGPPSPTVWPALSDSAIDGPRRFVTTHVGRFGGKRVKFQATVAETIINGPDGKTAASAFTTALTVPISKNSAPRPVIFVYNGGPGGASNMLFFGAFGPKRMTPLNSASMADPKTPLVDNVDSILDVADLVFIDPPDTGFSRRLPATPPRLFLSIDGDSYAVGQIILHWLSANGRLNSPKYLAGESYGSLRSVALARDLAKANPTVMLDGMLLISQAITYNGPASFGVKKGADPVRNILRLQDISASAWYHGKIDNQSQSVEQAVNKTAQFSRTEYTESLLLGNRLSADRRAQVAARLAELTGIPAGYYLAHNLKIEDYRHELLRDEGRALAQFDGRETEPLEGLPVDADRDWDAAVRGLTVSMQTYAATELGVKGLGDYISIVHDPYGYEEGWTYIVPPADGLDVVLTKVMKENPAIRVMVPQGIFDTTSSMGSTTSLFAMLDLPADRVVITFYGGGHMPYSDDEGLKKFAADVRTFVSGRNPSSAFPSVRPGRPFAAGAQGGGR